MSDTLRMRAVESARTERERERERERADIFKDKLLLDSIGYSILHSEDVWTEITHKCQYIRVNTYRRMTE